MWSVKGDFTKLPAIVVAGTSEGYRPVGIEAGGKAMLRLDGKPLVAMVVEALVNSPSIGDIYVVGQEAYLKK
ncbi:hypothetical protein FDZ71_09155, partial [bacterium]